MTVLAPPTLQVMTRVFKKTPAPIILVTLTAIAAHAPTPRVSSGRGIACALSRCIPRVVSQDLPEDYSRIFPWLSPRNRARSLYGAPAAELSLLSRLDPGPHPGAQPVVVGAEFGGQVQPRANLGRRIHGRIVQDVFADIGPRPEIVVAVVNVVADLGNHLGLEDKIEELVRGLGMRGRGRNQQCIVGD